MINISIPYTDVFKQKAPEFLELADVLELKWSKVEPVPGNHPRIFHWSEGIVQEDFFSLLYEQQLPQYLQEHQVDYFSFDLGPGCEKVKLLDTETVGFVYLPQSPAVTLDRLHHIVDKGIREIRTFFKGDLALEILNYYPTGAYENVCHPEIIREILLAHDIYLLVDLGHAEVTCFNLGIDMEVFLKQLPVEKIKQVHLSKPAVSTPQSFPAKVIDQLSRLIPRLPDQFAYDAHQLPDQKQMETALRLLTQSPLEQTYITIEYYKDVNNLLNSYKALKEIVTRLPN